MDKVMLYKLELICVKITPILVSALYLLNIIMDYCDLRSDILDYIAGTSLLTTIPMYVSSYAFRFCKYHRMFIHYIVVNNIITMIDDLVYIPVSDAAMFSLFLIVAGIFMYLVLYYHMKYGDRKVSFPSCYISKKCGR